MKKILFLMGVLFTFFLISGCSFKEDKKEAEQLSANLFEAIKAGDFEKAMSFYSEDFFKQISREEWSSTLAKLKAKLGDLRSYNLENWHINKMANTSGSGTYVLLQYKVVYSNYEATENLTVFKPVGGSPKIAGHFINSKGLLDMSPPITNSNG